MSIQQFKKLTAEQKRSAWNAYNRLTGLVPSIGRVLLPITAHARLAHAFKEFVAECSQDCRMGLVVLLLRRRPG
ncbi:hypothetical protein [Ensifer sp. LCM 4579]|uniref:hypothetical protein n=1 Tax=Ensifer sp. LCM 4579 TaxID=1848292 RepID=UPI001FCE27A6|nr:hypothetical protein [Ensifer sp. LCM 4579]